MYEIFILLLAGLSAGIVTGLLGASAVVVAVPLMVVFLGYDIFVAIGISLGIDVIASLVAMLTYKKYGNINMVLGIHVAIIAILGTLIGTHISFFIPKFILSGLTGFFVCLTGINLLTKKIKKEIKETVEDLHLHYKNKKYLFTMFAFFIIGIIGGSFGAGGGISMLLILTLVMGMKIHRAIGTSVFVMIFIALTGSVGHYLYQPFPVHLIFIAGIGAIIGAISSSKVANILNEKTLTKLVGVVLFFLGLALILKQIFDFGYFNYFTEYFWIFRTLI